MNSECLRSYTHNGEQKERITMGVKELKDLYERVDKVKPYAEKDGKKWVNFEDAAALNSFNAQEPKTGMQTRNADGSLASTGKTVHAVNPDYFFANRYKVKGAKGNQKLYVVSGHTTDGYRCIKEQASGRVFIKNVPCYIIVRDADGKLALEKQTMISDTEFISDFTNKLDNKSMAEILPLITAGGNDIGTDTMPI